MISEYKARFSTGFQPTLQTTFSLSASIATHPSQLPSLSVFLYTAPLSTVIEKHSVLHHSYADDSQFQKSALPHQIYDLFLSMQIYIDDIKSWMTLNKRKLNDDKTEAMIVSSGRKSRSLFPSQTL